MGFWGTALLSAVLFIGNNLYANNAATIAALLAPAMFGITQRTTDTTRIGVDPRGTVLLQRKPRGFCSGTFLSSTTVLTARHCVDTKNPNAMMIEGIASVNTFVLTTPADAPKLALGDPYDLAIVVFPKGTAEFLGIKSFPAIAEEGTNRISDQTTLVGYGGNDLSALMKGQDDGFGIRGWTNNEIASQEDGLLFSKPVEYTVEGKGRNPEMGNGIPGDSGGPLYNSDGTLVGVLSMMQVKADAEPLLPGIPLFHVVKGFHVSNVFLDVTAPLSRELIKAAIQCGDKVPCAESFAGSQVEAGKGSEQILDPKLFEHVSLRTGVYRLDDEVRYVIPKYEDRKLTQVMYRQGTGDKFGPMQGMVCLDAACTNPKTNETWLIDGTDSIQVDVPTTIRSPIGDVVLAGELETFIRD